MSLKYKCWGQLHKRHFTLSDTLDHFASRITTP